MTTPDVPYPDAVAKFPTVRQSLLAAFDACALEAHFETEFRRGWNEHHQARGQLFHRVAARCLKEMHAQGEKSIEIGVALAILDEVLAQDDADQYCPECGSEKILPGLTKFMERTCGNCSARFQTEFVNCPRKEIDDLVWVTKKWAYDNSFDTSHIVDVEKRLKATIRYSLRGLAVERVLTGQLDVLMVDPEDANHGIVIDWKDTWKLPAASTISEEGFFQQRFYAWLVMSVYKAIQRVTLREFYVRRSEVREATLWRHDMDQLDAEFSALVRKFDKAVQQRVFVPSPGAHCGWCSKPEKCPIPKDVRGAGKITSAREAKQAAAEMLVARRVLKRNEAALKPWASRHGDVEVRDSKGKRAFGHVEFQRTVKPTQEEIEEALLRNGGTLTQEDLMRLYKTSTSTRFTDFVPSERAETDSDVIDSLERSLARAAERKGL